ncbi:hypothetical protein D355_00359 [Enterococcus faecium SD1C-2]|nr:hypothetical protein D355_00359 [Enterococcus faecium SD1C-2]
MLVNKNRPGKATTSPGNTALSNEIFTQKSEFMDKTIRKVMKKDNVTIKDPYVKNIFK